MSYEADLVGIRLTEPPVNPGGVVDTICTVACQKHERHFCPYTFIIADMITGITRILGHRGLFLCVVNSITRE